MLLRVFLTFVMLGFFSFGGGYTFLPLMEQELVEKLHWLDRGEFLLSLTAGQISPGPIAVAGSFAGFLIGYNQHHTFLSGLLYSTVAWIGTNVATIICMSFIMRIYDKIAHHPAIEYTLQFVMPVVIGLIFYLGVKMGVIGVKSFIQLLIATSAFILAFTKKLDYAFIIIGGGVIGYLFL